MCKHLQGIQGREFVLRLRNHDPTVGGAFRHKGRTFRRFRLQPFNTAAQPAIRIVPQRCGGRSMGLPHHSFQHPIQGLSDRVFVGAGHLIGPWSLADVLSRGPIKSLNLGLFPTFLLDFDDVGLQHTCEGVKRLVMPLNNEAAHGVCVS